MHIWHHMARSSKECKTICSSPSRRQVGLEHLLNLNITPKTSNEIHVAICYIRFFTCIIMSVACHRMLVPIDFCNKVIQASDATLNRESSKLRNVACTTSSSSRQLESDIK